MRTKILGLLTVGLLVGPMAAQATLVNIDITINSPSTLTAVGSFDLDAANSKYSNLSVLLTGSFGPLIFSNANCDTCPLKGSTAGLIDDTLSQDNFLSDLSLDYLGGAFGGGLTVIFRGNSFSVEDPNGRLDGSYRFSTVPEPGTLTLLGLSLAGLGLSRRRKAN
jgi:hypothetical protein